MRLRDIRRYDLETFSYSGDNLRKRVREIEAVFEPGYTATTARQSDTFPKSLLNGLGTTYDVRPHNTERGHLIALEFGGPEDDRNQVPMWGRFNKHGAWKAFELEFGQLSPPKLYDGITVTIECDYSGSDDPRIPARFEIEARWVDKIVGKSGGYRRKRVWRIEHPRPVPMLKVEHQWSQRLVEEAYREMTSMNWTLEMSLPETATYQTPAIPNDAERPYAVLDFMAVSKLMDFDLRRNVDNNKEFSEDQREAVIQVNRIFNNGFLISDNTEDFAHRTDEFADYIIPKFAAGTLMVEGGDQAPEVDHIIPKSLGGCNAFSNAQLVSRAWNNWKRAKIEQDELDVLKSNRRIMPSRWAKN